MEMRDILENEILFDAGKGDTTVLAEILVNLSDDYIFNCLSDDNQKRVLNEGLYNPHKKI
jgi:hypothetical protein